MNNAEQIQSRRSQVLAELVALGPMRKGSISEQVVHTVLKDGTPRQRGPYTVYTFKKRGRTISQRLSDAGQIARYREQIAAFRRFQDLSTQLVEVSQRLADLQVAGAPAGKKNSRR
ncbi:MAG: hypothetical protein NTW86_07580 [Candidatus Sumerlaeota bacterium]|nr:hypothetical protein [Candidatus Sumerlaeota bacterium]